MVGRELMPAKSEDAAVFDFAAERLRISESFFRLQASIDTTHRSSRWS